MTLDNDNGPAGAATPGGATTTGDTPPMTTTDATAASPPAVLGAYGRLPLLATPAGAAVTDPATGEVLHVADASTATLAEVIDWLAEHLRVARSAKALLDAEVIGRLTEAKVRTDLAGSFDVERGARRDWDHEATRAALADLVEAGMLAADAVDTYMPEVAPPPRKPDGRALNKLLTDLAGEVADDIEKLQLVGALGRARKTAPFLKVTRTAIDGSAVEEPVA